jgi:hypothetical protein
VTSARIPADAATPEPQHPLADRCRKRACKRHALLLAAGQLTGVFSHGILKADESQQFSLPLTKGLGSLIPLDAQRGYHVTIAEAEIAQLLPVSFAEAKFYEAQHRWSGKIARSATSDEPDNLAVLVAFLSSPKSRYITG